MTTKTILCYGDSNLRGFIPGSFNKNTGLSARFGRDKRWTGILQTLLGSDYYVIEEGINGRTTTRDEIYPGRPHRNGLGALLMCLESHYPIDLIIFMLGTNDVKLQFNHSSEEIVEGMRRLVRVAKSSNIGTEKILIIAPQPIVKIADLHPQFDDIAIEKSKALAPLYQRLAEEESCGYLDAAQFLTSSRLDGVHIEEQDMPLLAAAVAEKVKQIGG